MIFHDLYIFIIEKNTLKSVHVLLKARAFINGLRVFEGLRNRLMGGRRDGFKSWFH